MHHLLQLVRPVTRLTPSSSPSFLRTLTVQVTAKATSPIPTSLTRKAQLKPHGKKAVPKDPYKNLPELPKYTGPLPPPSKTADEILAAGAPYLVRRTPGAQLQVYRRWRGGGTLEQILIKKVEGDRKRFVADLTEALGCKEEHVKLIPLTQHIVVKGDHYHRTRSWLIEKGF